MWLSDGIESEIEDFDPVKMTFTIKQKREMHPGDRFILYFDNPKWCVHHNMIDNCRIPESLDSFNGKKVKFDNIIY